MGCKNRKITDERECHPRILVSLPIFMFSYRKIETKRDSIVSDIPRIFRLKNLIQN